MTMLVGFVILVLSIEVVGFIVLSRAIPAFMSVKQWF